ncbi:MAG: nucleotidyltransferase domain-containing protein, partial [Nanoarchaeota archaeon]|nr:nucleotidyltransferase domain-containing protein [Nanoarchaeota archaeon]
MLQKSTTQKILEIFFDEPTKAHYLKEISRKALISHTSIKKPLEELVKLNLILKRHEKKGKRKFPIFEANLEHPKFRRLKKSYNLENLYESGIVEKIRDALMPRSIVLFGSYSRGEDIEDSDIDIFVESSKEEIKLKSFEDKLKRKVNML